MARSKWIRLKSRREKVRSVCARMLRSRVAAIAHYLPLAARKSAENSEYVHQLRVWTRRAGTAIDLCRDLLSKRNRRRLKKLLALLRHAAGEARDADVLREGIAALKPGLAREHLLLVVEQRRRAAQQPIIQANEDLRGGRELREQLARVVKTIDDTRRFEPWAREQLHPLVKKFLKQGRTDLAELEQLHKLRIAAKRLRYALELTWDALGKSPRDKAYVQLGRLQSQLGSINDARQLVREIERALTATKKRTLQTQLRRLLAAERRRLAASQKQWRESWIGKNAKRLKRVLKKLV